MNFAYIINVKIKIMKHIRNFIVAICLIGFMVPGFAQEKVGFSIHVGGALPMGQFTASPSYVVPCALGDKGSAIFGASLGLRYNYTFANTRIEDCGAGIFIAADAMWNYINKDVRDVYDLTKCTKPMYLNVPIILGGTWMSDFVNSSINIWVEAGIGCDLFLKTTEGWKGNTISYKMNPEFACEGGFGVIFLKTYSIGVHYYWLGMQEVRAKGVEYGEGFLAPPKMALHMMEFKVGFHF